MGARVDEFTGTAGEYIKYLEGTVSSLRQRSCTCHTRVSQTPNNETVAAPPQQPPTRSVDSTPRSDHGSMSVEHGRKEAQLLTPPGKRTFEIYQWHPEHAPEPKTKHGHVENGQPFWKRTAQTLVDTTPDAQNWWQIVEDLGVYSAMRHGCVADFLLDINQQTPSVDYAGNAILPGLIDDRNSQLLSQVMAYASAARARDQTASFALMLVNFQKFLLLSTCAVLHDLGVVKEAIIDVVKVGFGNSTDNHSWRLVQTAVFLNKRVQTLNSNGWRDRASELLLICKSIRLVSAVFPDYYREPPPVVLL